MEIPIVAWWWNITQLLFSMFLQLWSTERSDFVSTTYNFVSTTIFRNLFSYTYRKKDMKAIKNLVALLLFWLGNQLTWASESLYEQVCLMRLGFERYFERSTSYSISNQMLYFKLERTFKVDKNRHTHKHTTFLTLSSEGIHYNKHRVNFIYS